MRISRKTLPFSFFSIVLYFALFWKLLNLEPIFVYGSDFISFFTGALIVRDGNGQLLYNTETQYQIQSQLIEPFKMSILNRYATLPFVTLLYIPFTYTSYLSSYKLFGLLNLSLLSFLIYLLGRTFKFYKKGRYFLYILPFFYFPTFTTLFMGQVSYILATLFLLIYRFIKLQKSFSAGLTASLLIFIKIQFLTLTPFLFLLSKNKKKFLTGFLFCLLFTSVINIIITGYKPLLNYPSYLLSSEVPEYGNRVSQMFTLQAILTTLFFYSKVNSVWPLAINFLGYLLSLFLFNLSYKKIKLNNSFVVLSIFSVLFAVHMLSHDLVILLVPIFILLNEIKKFTINLKAVLIVVLFLFPLSIMLKLVIIAIPLLLGFAYYLLLVDRQGKPRLSHE